MLSVAILTSFYFYGTIITPQIIVALIEVEKPSEKRHVLLVDGGDEERERTKTEMEQTRLVMGKLTEPCFERLLSSLSSGK